MFKKKDGKLTGINHTNGKGWYRKEYVCRACNKRVIQEAVHSSMDELLNSLNSNPKYIPKLKSALKKVWDNNESYRLERHKNFKAHRDGLLIKKDNLIDLLANDEDMREDIKERINKVKVELANVDLMMAKDSNIDEDFYQFSIYALSYVENIRRKWNKLTGQRLIKCKKLLFNNEIIIGQDGRVYTPKISPIYTLINEKSDPKVTQNNGLVELVGTAPTSDGLSWLIVYRFSLFWVLRSWLSKQTNFP